MRKLIYIMFLLAGIISLNAGIGKQETQAMPTSTSNSITHTYSSDTLVFFDVLNNHGDNLVAGHSSHRSHASHGSHGSHSSHYSSRF